MPSQQTEFLAAACTRANDSDEPDAIRRDFDTESDAVKHTDVNQYTDFGPTRTTQFGGIIQPAPRVRRETIPHPATACV